MIWIYIEYFGGKFDKILHQSQMSEYTTQRKGKRPNNDDTNL